MLGYVNVSTILLVLYGCSPGHPVVQALQGMFSNSNTLEQLRASWGQV